MASQTPTLEEYIAEELLIDPNACECQLKENYTDLYIKSEDVDYEDEDDDDDDEFWDDDEGTYCWVNRE